MEQTLSSWDFKHLSDVETFIWSIGILKWHPFDLLLVRVDIELIWPYASIS